MDIFRLIQDIKAHLKFSFDEVDKWFEKDKITLNYYPLNGGWTGQQILEHIYLTNFYLLILIEKGSKKAMRNYRNLDLNIEIENYTFDKENFEKVGEYGAFEWIRPEHMEPKGKLNLNEIRNLISQQYHQCSNYLELMKNGEGLLCKTTMTVNELGKINVYEYIYFLSLHAQRHIIQMKNNELENNLKKSKQMQTNIFFTADHHFGHANIIKFSERPFESMEEMNEELIKRWNEKIGKDDMVYHLGDVSLGKPDFTKEILDRLNGKIHLIKGNHEYSALRVPERFEWIKDYHELYVEDESHKMGKQKIMLFHYAMRTWNGSHHGTWQLFGHSHGTLLDDEMSLSIDVGVDCHNFYPVSYEEIKELMKKKKWTPPFAPRN